ncbi:MAG: sugar phosphate isomerase/epimerase family protein, partial [Gemmatimonadaceae bacterium]
TIGIQLYTVRREMAQDVESTLATIAGIGYREVEFAGLFNHPAADVRRMLDRHGLAAPSSHVGLPDDMRAWSAMLDDALTLGQSYIICPSFPTQDLSPDGMKRIAARFNAAGAAAKKAGLQFGFHNHAEEFKPVDGRVPYDLLLAECDPSLVTFEIDIYWMVTGGRDPLAYLAKYPGRFPMVHAKDRTADGRMADVGTGVIDFPEILAAFKRGGLQHCFVERDDAPDPFASARASFAYLDALTF